MLQIGFTDQSGAPVPAAVIKIVSFSIDNENKGLIAHLAMFWNLDSYNAKKTPIGTFNADLSAAFDAIVSAAPTAQEIGVSNLYEARTYNILHSLNSVSAGGNTLDLTTATLV